MLEPIDHTARHEEFTRLIRGGEHQKAASYIQREYELGGDYKLSVGEREDKKHLHAATKGKGQGNKIKVEYKKSYVERGAGSRADFDKVVSTLRHERVHVEQRLDPDYKDNSSKAEREFLAYSTELEPHPNFSTLSGDNRERTLANVTKNYNEMSSNKQDEHFERYSRAFMRDW